MPCRHLHWPLYIVDCRLMFSPSKRVRFVCVSDTVVRAKAQLGSLPRRTASLLTPTTPLCAFVTTNRPLFIVISQRYKRSLKIHETIYNELFAACGQTERQTDKAKQTHYLLDGHNAVK